jgi:pyruvate/2-oxoglutarate dehydrogenase complex dihydrolipoamide acyltransferase (E2) component
MISRVLAPRFNANDDTAVVVAINVAPGDHVSEGDALLELETTKATSPVESPMSGVVRTVLASIGDEVQIGQELVVLADNEDEEIQPATVESAESDGPRLTVKASLRARELGLEDHAFAGSVGRITVEDVERIANQMDGPIPSAPVVEPLVRAQLGMARTVRTASTNTVAAYLETIVDMAPINGFATDRQQKQGRLSRPDVEVLAYAFALCLAEMPRLNSSTMDDSIVIYPEVNLAIAVDAPDGLFLPVVQDAASKSLDDFVDNVSQLKREMFSKSRDASHLSGATAGFTSLAAYDVTRHIPILLPGTSVMLAHSAPSRSSDGGESTVLGVTYDHQLHSGAEIGRLLRLLRSYILEPSKLG